MWVPSPSFLAAARDVLGLRLPQFDAYQAWEDCARHGGFRVLHEQFCIVCDFPELIRVDDAYRPHCEDGPSHRWRDGWALYHWHGTAVPAHWIEQRETVSVAEIMAERDVEKRAAGLAILRACGRGGDLPFVVIDGDPSTEDGALVEISLDGLPEPGRYLMARCPRNGTICEGVPRVSDIDGLPIDTALAAQAWGVGLPQNHYQFPTHRT